MGISVHAYTSQVGDIALDNDYRLYDLRNTELNAVRCPDANVAEKMASLILQVKNEGDTIKMGRRLAQMGDAYAAKSDFKNAERLYRKAVSLLEQKVERTSLCISYKQLGLLYKKMGRRQDAFTCLKRSYDMAKTIGFKMVMMQTSEQMAELTKLSDPAKALEYMTLATALKDSLYNEQANQLASSYAAKLSVTEKNHTIEQQQNRLKRQMVHQGSSD